MKTKTMKLKSGDKVIYKNETRTIYSVYSKDSVSLCLMDEDGYEYEDVEEDYLTPIKKLQLIIPKKIPSTIKIDVCYTSDENGAIIFDEEQMRQVFETKLNNLKN